MGFFRSTVIAYCTNIVEIVNVKIYRQHPQTSLI